MSSQLQAAVMAASFYFTVLLVHGQYDLCVFYVLHMRQSLIQTS